MLLLDTGSNVNWCILLQLCMPQFSTLTLSMIAVLLARNCWGRKNEKWSHRGITKNLMHSKCWVNAGWSQPWGNVRIAGRTSHSPSLQNISPFPLMEGKAK